MGCNTAQPVCRGWVRVRAGADLYHDTSFHVQLCNQNILFLGLRYWQLHLTVHFSFVPFQTYHG